MFYKTNIFKDKNIKINKKKVTYYLSNLLSEFNFTHAFFTKESSNFELDLLSKEFNNNKINYFNNQIHSNSIVVSSKLMHKRKFNADGIVSNESAQNIWIYTADCMPILVADKVTRLVAAIHCGRKGLEKKIIINTLNKMEDLGSLKKNILVAIGPSISQLNYLVDDDCIRNFYKNIFIKFNYNLSLDSRYILKHSPNRYAIDIRGYAFQQLIYNKINPENIEISNYCTFTLKDKFYSWRREKIKERNWNFISSK